MVKRILLKNRLIIFLRNPRLGEVKTRLARTVGDEAALAIYYRLIDHTRSVSRDLPLQKVLYYSDFVDTEDNWPNATYQKALQSDGDLGNRMKQAFIDAFTEGCKFVVVIGTDCMELSAEIIMLAFEKLKYHDAVIGPAADGGYYLLGLNSFHDAVFENKNWGTDSVLRDTETDFDRLGLKWIKLAVLRDVDTFDDLNDSLKAFLIREGGPPKH